MNRQSVESSNLASVGYDAENEILEIEFNNGGVYRYFDVPQIEYDNLIGTSSHGAYFAANIQDSYHFEKV